MKIDKKIQKRFEELVNRADSLVSEDLINNSVYFGWAMSSLNLLERVLGNNSYQYKHFLKAHEEISEMIYEDSNYAVFLLGSCVGIMESAYEDYKNGYLFDLRTLVKAELGDDILEQSKSLLKANHKDIACVVAGISLELAIKELCNRNSIPFNSKTKFESLNLELRKAGVYNESMRKQLTAWIAKRNHAAHGEFEEYNQKDVRDLINGVERFVGEYLS